MNKYKNITDYVVFDLETTGLSHDCEIIEIGAVKIRNNIITDKFETLIKPLSPIPYMATKVNGITNEMVADSPCFNDVLSLFLDFIGSDILIGHNIASFDMRVLSESAMQAYGVIIENEYIDTLSMARHCIYLDHYRLSDICDYFNIVNSNEHRAVADAIATAECFQNLQLCDYDNFCVSKKTNCNTIQHQKFKPNYTDETKALQTLQGLLFGVTCDGILTKEEVYAVKKWLNEYKHLSGNFPFDKAYSEISKALEDGILEPQELDSLMKTFLSLIDPVKANSDCESASDVSGKLIYADTIKELKTKVFEVKIQLGKGIDITAERDTFDAWAQRLLKKKKLSISSGRYNVYVYRLNNLEPIRNMQITKIRTADIQSIIYDMHEENYSRCVLNEVKNTAKQVFQLAIDNRVLDYNPAFAVDIPKTQSPERRRALTDKEIQMITSPSDNSAHRAAMIMLYAGLRRGELIPLLWSDIDLLNNTIAVNKSVEIINGKTVLKDTTKTPAGMRTVYIPDVLADFLRSETRNTNMLVCPSAKGEMLSESAFKRMWESYMHELNFEYGDFSKLLVPDKKDPSRMTQYVKPKSRFAPQKIPTVIDNITPHMLRHTFITLMYFAGVDILTAKEQAGHSDISTTMEIYTHLDQKFKKKQINKLNDYLNPLNNEENKVQKK